MANLMNTVKLIIHICVIVHAYVNTCNIHVCLTWEFENGRITFKCKVNRLNLNVEFYNPAKQKEGWCIMPNPNTKCYPLHNNNLTQDKLTNTTTLTVKSSMAHNNGTWKCTHGTNISEAIVKIPVLKKDTSMEDTKDENCFEEFYAWTMLGFTMTIVITLLYNTNYLLQGRKSGGSIFGNHIFVYDCLCVPFSNLPTVDVQQPTDPVSTDTNSSLILVCTLKSTLPVKHVYWTKTVDGNTTTIQPEANKYSASTPSTPSLTISNVDQSDAGNYACLAANRDGTRQSSTIQLSVTEIDHSSPVLDCKTEHYDPPVLVSISKKKVIITIVLAVIVVVFPVCVGFIAKDCKYKEYFIIYGIFKALVMLIFSYNLVTHFVKDYEPTNTVKKSAVPPQSTTTTRETQDDEGQSSSEG